MFTDPSFKDFQDCLDAEMKHLTALGVGSKVKEAHAFSEDEENKLRDLGLLGDSSPEMRDLSCINYPSTLTRKNINP